MFEFRPSDGSEFVFVNGLHDACRWAADWCLGGILTQDGAPVAKILDDGTYWAVA